MYEYLLNRRRPSRSTRTNHFFPYSTHFRFIAETFTGASALSRKRVRSDTPGGSSCSSSRNHCGCASALARAEVRGCSRSCASRSEEHTSELQSLMRISYAVFCLTKQKPTTPLHYKYS